MAGQVTGQSPAVLWLACGKCAESPNLVTISEGRSKLTGEPFGVAPRRDGTWTAWPRRGAKDEWTHHITCKRCRYEEKVSGARMRQWWDEFTATRRRRDTRYLGRDR